MTIAERKAVMKKELIKLFLNYGYNNVTFIGIDRSLTSTGIAIIHKGKFVKQMEFSTKEIEEMRLIEIGRCIVKECKNYELPLICMEDYSFDKPYQAHQLGELGGVVKAFLRLKGYPYLSTSPGTIKKYVSGKGNTPKDLIPMFVSKKFKIEPMGGDAADAIACVHLAYNAFAYKSGNHNYTQKEKEAFDALMSTDPERPKRKSTRRKNAQLGLQIRE